MPIEKLLKECKQLYKENNYSKVINICDKILKHDFNNQRAISYKARCLYLLEEYEESLTLLNNAIILYPNNYHFLHIKAEVLMYKEEYDKAIECFEKILEIKISKKVHLSFIKQDYGICLSSKIDQLIEMEKYVDAWQCYNRKLKIESDNLEYSAKMDRFKNHVKRYTSRVKYRQYHVKISSNEAKGKLIKFLKKNGFKSSFESGLLFLIDVVDKITIQFQLMKLRIIILFLNLNSMIKSIIILETRSYTENYMMKMVT